MYIKGCFGIVRVNIPHENQLLMFDITTLDEFFIFIKKLHLRASSELPLEFRWSLLLLRQELSIIELSVNVKLLLSDKDFKLSLASCNFALKSKSPLWVSTETAILEFGNFNFTDFARSTIFSAHLWAESVRRLFVPAWTITWAGSPLKLIDIISSDILICCFPRIRKLTDRFLWKLSWIYVLNDRISNYNYRFIVVAILWTCFPLRVIWIMGTRGWRGSMM